MDITTEHRDGYELIKLTGELRREAGEQLEETLHPMIAPKNTALIIDLSGINAIDSSGLSQLISLATHARLSSSRVVLFGPTPFVSGVFELTRLNAWFDIADDLAGAEALLASADNA